MYSNYMDAMQWLEDTDVLEMIADKFSSSVCLDNGKHHHMYIYIYIFEISHEAGIKMLNAKVLEMACG